MGLDDVPAVSREIVLDKDLGVALHLSFLISGVMLDGQSRALGRVVSLVGFTTVQGRIQYDIFHASPLLQVEDKGPVQFQIGFEDGGKSAEYDVTVSPRESLTWGAVRDAEDLRVASSEL